MEHNNRRYFKSLEELSNPSSVEEKEFLPETPGKNVVDEGDFDLKSSRRDFLKFMGFSISAATLAACTKTPVKHAIPYVVKPNEVDPGIPNYYASFFPDGGYGVLVKTREGRPIKIEGNDMDPLSQGGTTAAGQASVLSLYDEGRLQGPMKKGAATTWEELTKDVYGGLRDVTKKGGKIAILTPGIHSPSTLRAIDEFKNTHPTTSHVQYDAVSYYGIRKAHEQAFGKAIIPTHQISEAKTIVSFGADFLGTWLTPLAFTKQYSSVRDVTLNDDMAYHVQFESHLSLAGSKADLRVPCKPSEQGAAMVAVYNALAKKAGVSALSNPSGFNQFCTEEKINHVADELWSTRNDGSMVLCGSNDVNQQLLCIEINNLLGAYGTTIDGGKPCNLNTGNDEDMKRLVDEMNAGAIDALIVYGANPSYNYPEAEKFNAGLAQVGLTVSLSDRLDETTSKVQYVAADHHWLESWNDYNPKGGQYNLSQPTISNIFDTRQGQESLLSWAKKPVAYYDFIKETWMMNSSMSGKSFDMFWKQSLHDGVYVEGRAHSDHAVAAASSAHAPTAHNHGAQAHEGADASSGETVTTTEHEEVTSVEQVGILQAAKEVVKGDSKLKEAVHDVRHGRTSTDTIAYTTTTHLGDSELMGTHGSSMDMATITVAAGSLDLTSISTALVSQMNNASGMELTLYTKTGLMDGKDANNPWLLELPDSISKVSWDNYACVSPVEAEQNKWHDGDLITVSANGVSIENVPVLLQPGQLSGTISIALGYGHQLAEKQRKAVGGYGGESDRVGFNAYPLVANKGIRNYSSTGVNIEKTGTGYELAKTQTHHHIQIPAGWGVERDKATTTRRKSDIVKETSLGTLVAYRSSKGHNDHHDEGHGHGHSAADNHKVYDGDEPGKYSHLNLYPDWKESRNYYKAIHWGMSVNLNTCTGCNACVIACQSENNIPVVGKSEVMRRRELHWIRIDRYFASPERKEEDRDLLYTDNPSVMFQPLMCQHCDNAPCENVCPVNAINHSSEGINQQIYNRCMGTRYCANNCPYKVRRFNWFAYYDNEEFNYNFTMNSDLGRMVLNPDVTVRARGVMEKCSFCMQRIQAAKLVAKGENRALKDGDVVTACQQACPANAIQFGNMNDPESKVSKVIEGDLSYRLVELLNTQNSVHYTTQVRNIKLASEMPAPAEEEHHAEEAHS